VGLSEYRRKRRFDRTPEPEGGASEEERLRFVVQKHRASHLHYDLRLELDGVLKSWAVPKGPSLDPADKRLAMRVEDHPLDYRAFEGTIPPGNYGAGTVMVWDEVPYTSSDVGDLPAAERALRAGLKAGKLSINMRGHKLKGEFHLVKTRGPARSGKEDPWLLMKRPGADARKEDVRALDRSAVTGRSLEEIEAGLARAKKPRRAAVSIPAEAPRSPFPRDVRPMLATPVDAPFDRQNWVFEVKWDGYRAIAEIERGRVRLYSRHLLSFNEKFAPVAESLRAFGRNAVLDGEVVCVDAQGRARFQLLQNYQKTGRGKLLYYVFDVLHLDGRDLRGLPLLERKALLAKALPPLPNVRLSDHVRGAGEAFFREAARRDLEGVVAKDGASPYREGQRGRDWLKIKTAMRQEAVIGGFTEPRGGRKHLGALVLGVFEAGRLRYIGHAGGGFDEKTLRAVHARLKPLAQDVCPFEDRPKTNAPVRWVRPEAVCEVAFREWTDDGSMRQPVFLGLREDKRPAEVRREAAQPPPRVYARTDKEKDRNVEIGGHVVHLTRLDKVFWPAERYTKGDVIEYYRDMAPVILPYLVDRPQSLHRHPDGIDGESFYHKDMGGQAPKWVRTVTFRSEGEDRDIAYMLCQNEAALAYMANLGCIELNPWNSRYRRPDRPDYMIIDLDPDDIEFEAVIEAALAAKEVLEQAGAECICKTSGATGLHVCVPLGARYTYDQAKDFAQIVAFLVQRRLPRSTSVERMPARRRRRVYLDYLQNRRGQTLAAPYSLRPRPGAPVSAPLRWKEVRRGLNPVSFNLKTIKRRVEETGDLWKPVLDSSVDLKDCLERLEGSLKRRP
jgi:bifunctional non-homologous end joining protein LigD